MKSKTILQANKRRQHRGFTLTEIAIVLGIIGLILGAIWAAASAVYSNMKVSQAEVGITYAAQKVRSIFAGANNTGVTGAAGPVDITAPGMFPVSWAGTTAGITGNPWRQNPPASEAYVIADPSHPTMFSIELDGISSDGCQTLLNFYNSNASTLKGGQIAGLVGNNASGNSLVGCGGGPCGAEIAGINIGYVPASTCLGGTWLGSNTFNYFSVTFDMSQM